MNERDKCVCRNKTRECLSTRFRPPSVRLGRNNAIFASDTLAFRRHHRSDLGFVTLGLCEPGCKFEFSIHCRRGRAQISNLINANLESQFPSLVHIDRRLRNHRSPPLSRCLIKIFVGAEIGSASLSTLTLFLKVRFLFFETGRAKRIF